MENRTLYVVRHGKIQQEDDQRRYIGQIDLPLAAAGRQQARGLRGRCGRGELGPVFCSALSRSRETAEIIAGGAGVPIVAREDLRELSMGEREGSTFREATQSSPEAYR